jgi:hypothetical protein
MNEIELNYIDKEFRQFLIDHAPPSIVMVGEIVLTKWADWKKPHIVKICKTGINLVKLDLTIGEYPC